MQLFSQISIIVLLTGLFGCRSNSDHEENSLAPESNHEVEMSDTNWLSFNYDTVRVYYYDNFNDVEKDNGVVHNRKLNSTILNPEGEILTAEQISLVGKIMNGEFNPDKITSAACFFPRHGIVFFYSQKIVAEISICFECNRVESSPLVKELDSEPFKEIFQDFNIPMHIDEFPMRSE